MNDFDNIHPRSEPERAQALSTCENLTSFNRQRQFILHMLAQPMTCPLCDGKCSYYAAADKDITIEESYDGLCHCPHCGIGLTKIMPLVKVAGPGWYWGLNEGSRSRLLEIWLQHGAEKREKPEDWVEAT